MLQRANRLVRTANLHRLNGPFDLLDHGWDWRFLECSMVHSANPSRATANTACGTNLQYPIRVQSFEVSEIDAQFDGRNLQSQQNLIVALRWLANWPIARLAFVWRSNEGDATYAFVEAYRP